MGKLTAVLALPLLLLGLAVVGLGSASPASAAITTSLSLSPTTVAKGGSTYVEIRSSAQPRVLVLQELAGSRWVTAQELPAYRNYGFRLAAGSVDRTRTLRVATKASNGAWSTSRTATLTVGAGSPAQPSTSFSTTTPSVAVGGTIGFEARSSAAPDAGSFQLQERRDGVWTRVASLPSYRNYGFTHAAGATAGTRTFRTVATVGGTWVGSNWVNVTVTGGTSGNPQLDAARAQILRDTNEARAANGLPPLHGLAALHNTAQGWAAHMARTGEFRHNPSSTSTYPSGWRRAGENIAYGYDAESVVDAWMNSTGHRANILGDYTHLGIGVAWNAQGTPYYVQNFAKY